MSVNQFGNGIASHEVSWFSDPIGQLMSSKVKVLRTGEVPVAVVEVVVAIVVVAGPDEVVVVGGDDDVVPVKVAAVCVDGAVVAVVGGDVLVVPSDVDVVAVVGVVVLVASARYAAAPAITRMITMITTTIIREIASNLAVRLLNSESRDLRIIFKHCCHFSFCIFSALRPN